MFTFPIASNTLVSRTSESVIKVTIFKLLHMLDHARVAVSVTPVTVELTIYATPGTLAVKA